MDAEQAQVRSRRVSPIAASRRAGGDVHAPMPKLAGWPGADSSHPGRVRRARQVAKAIIARREPGRV